MPGGRLDPPLSLRLDEAALICPIPLHQWTADMGGRGVSIVACFQSRSQVIDRYGDAKAATIINNSGARVLFGGTADRDDLNYWSTLAGDRDEPITTTDMHGRVASRTTRRVPVLAPAQLATLPPARVVVFTSTMPPVIGRAEQAYRRHDVQAEHDPRAWDVRARRLASRAAHRVEMWAWRHAVFLLGALGGALGGAARATAVGQAPAWAGALAGAFLGITVAFLLRHLAIAAWRSWRPPIQRWVRRRLAPLWRWLVAHIHLSRGVTHYQSYGSDDPEPATEPLPVVALSSKDEG